MSVPSFVRQYILGESKFGLGGVLGKAVALLNSFIILTHLSLYQFGLYQLVLAGIGLADAFLLSGIDGVVMNDLIRLEKAKQYERARRLFVEFMVFRLFSSALVFVAVFFLAPELLRWYDKDIVTFTRIAASFLLVDTVFVFFRVFLLSRARFGFVAMQPFINEVSKLGFFLFFLFTAQIGLREVFVAHVGSAVVFILVALLLFGRESFAFFSGKFAPRGLLFVVVSTYGKWAIFRGFLKQLHMKMDPWLIKLFISTEAVAIYSVASSLVDMLRSLTPANVLTSLLPKEVDSPDRFRAIFVRGIKYFLWFGSLLGIVAMLAFPVAIAQLVPKYLSSLPFFFALLITVPLYGISKVTGAVLIAHREQKFIFFRTTLSLVVLVVLAPFLYSGFGIWGIVSVAVLDYFLATVLFFARARRYVGGKTIKISEFFWFDAFDQQLLRSLIKKLFRKTASV